MAEALPQAVEHLGLFPQAPPHLYRAIVPQKPPDLSGDLGDGVSGKAGAIIKVKALDGFQKTKTAQLVEVVRVYPPAVIPPHYAPDQAVVFNNCLLTGVPVTLLRRPQKLQCSAHFTAFKRGASRFFITTAVPFPGTERTVNLSIKLSIIVKPMPLRSSPPVVNMGCRALSTSDIPRP